jgi:hypothetical protein
MADHFFLELRMTVAHHFIKVEENSTRVQEDPNPSTKNKHTHTAPHVLN